MKTQTDHFICLHLFSVFVSSDKEKNSSEGGKYFLRYTQNVPLSWVFTSQDIHKCPLKLGMYITRYTQNVPSKWVFTSQNMHKMFPQVGYLYPKICTKCPLKSGIYARPKLPIGEILRFPCKNLGSEVCAEIYRLGKQILRFCKTYFE